MTAKSRVLTFSIVIAVFVTALAFVWQQFGTPTALAALGSLAIGSFLGFRRVREDGENGEVLPYGRLTAALPKSWHNWMFGESGSGPRKD
jgi:hypothetical protein